MFINIISHLNSPGSIQPGCHFRRTELFQHTGLRSPTRYPFTPGSTESTCGQSALPGSTTSQHNPAQPGIERSKRSKRSKQSEHTDEGKDLNITMQGKQVKNASEETLLSVIIDSNLSWKAQIQKIRHSVLFKLSS